MKTNKYIVLFTFLIALSLQLFSIETCAKPKAIINGSLQGSFEINQQLEDLSKQVTKSLLLNNKKVVAIIDFSSLDGSISEFGRFLSEELITKLFKTNRFYVIERNLLSKLLNENKLSYNKLFSKETIAKLGALLGVEAIVTGTITDMLETVRINARIISTENGLIISTAQVEITKSQQVITLLNRGLTNNYSDGFVQKEKEVEAPQKPKLSGKAEVSASSEFYFDSSLFSGIKKLGFEWIVKVTNGVGINIDRYCVELWNNSDLKVARKQLDKIYLLDNEIRVEPNSLIKFALEEKQEVKQKASESWSFTYVVTLLGTDDNGNKISIISN